MLSEVLSTNNGIGMQWNLSIVNNASNYSVRLLFSTVDEAIQEVEDSIDGDMGDTSLMALICKKGGEPILH